MVKLRTIVMWTALVCLAMLAVMSVIGAFIGSESAARLFACSPLAILGPVLLWLLIVSVVIFRGIVRSFGMLAAHAGCIFILASAIWSSNAVQDIRRGDAGEPQIREGFMQIAQGGSESTVFNADGSRLGELPFSVKLQKFWIEYYPSEWEIHGGTARIDANDRMQWDTEQIRYQLGRELRVPKTRIKIKVLRQLAAARSILRVRTRDGHEHQIAAEAGKEISLGDPELRLTILQTFRNAAKVVKDGQTHLVETQGAGMGPAMKVQVNRAGYGISTSFLFLRSADSISVAAGSLELQYFIVADPDHSNVSSPAFELELKLNDEIRRVWLAATGEAGMEWLPLKSIFAGLASRQDLPSLFLLKASPAVRDYKSQLVIIRDGRQVSQATIEVNKPLHYGGYHFYQSSYDQQGQEYTVLEVVSDSGLSAFYAGVVLVGVGCVWRFWVSPVIKKLRRARI